jgi:hypothetical protein
MAGNGSSGKRNSRGDDDVSSPPRKFVRTSKVTTSAKKLAKARKKDDKSSKQLLTPCINVIQFKCGTKAHDPARFRKEDDGKIVAEEYYNWPYVKMINSGDGDFPKKAGVHYAAIKCDKNHKRMPKAEGSQYGWNSLIALSDNGIVMDQESVKEDSQEIVNQWNIFGANQLIFKHPSKVRLGTVIVDEEDPPTLDTHIIDRDVIEIIKVYYEILDDKDLLVLMKDTELVGKFFEDVGRGVNAIKTYVNGV